MTGKLIPTYSTGGKSDGYLLVLRGHDIKWISQKQFDELPDGESKASK